MGGIARDVVDEGEWIAKALRTAVVGVSHQTFANLARLEVGIGKKHPGSILKIGVKCHAQQTRFARSVTIAQRKQHRLLSRLGVHTTDAAVAFGHPEVVVGAPDDFPRNINAADHGAGINCGVADGDLGVGLGSHPTAEEE